MTQATIRRFRKLLTPVSFSEHTDATFDYSRRIAQVNEGIVILLHVVPTQSYRLMRSVYRPEESGGANEDHAEQVSRELLAETARQKLAGVPVDIVVRRGANPAKVVLDVQRELACDLVIVGKSEFGELGARLQGGLAEKVIRGANCAVWSVSVLERFAKQESVRHVLAPIELDRSGISVVRGARSVAEPQRGSVTLLHVILTDPTFLQLRRDVYGFEPDEPVSLAKAQRTALRRLEEIAAEHLSGIPHEIVVTVGYDRPTTILEEEQAREPSLIVMMAPTQSGFFHVILGSDAETVARGAACSVMTLCAERPKP
jgi:nucleotide-binding universal stress UspA family protein